MTRGKTLLIVALVVGVLLIAGASSASEESMIRSEGTAGVQLGDLAAPTDADLVATPHGYYGAPRYVSGSDTQSTPPTPGAKVDHYHQGVDLVAPVGSPIYAIGAGQLVSASPGFGKTVLKLQLDQPGRFDGAEADPQVAYAVYADLGTAERQAGEHVAAGERIGTVGNHGFFHFAVKNAANTFFNPSDAGFPA